MRRTRKAASGAAPGLGIGPAGFRPEASGRSDVDIQRVNYRTVAIRERCERQQSTCLFPKCDGCGFDKIIDGESFKKPISKQQDPYRVCDCCGHEAGGHVVQYRGHSGNPQYFSCSDECDDILVKLVVSNKGYVKMSELTDMEKTAIKAARPSLWDGLVAAFGEDKAMEVFGLLSEDQVDSLIGDVWNGCRVSMQQQSIRGEIPF